MNYFIQLGLNPISFVGNIGTGSKSSIWIRCSAAAAGIAANLFQTNLRNINYGAQ